MLRISKQLEKNVNSEKLGNALAKSKDIAINLLGNMLYRTRVEPIRDEEGIKGLKAHWIGEPGESVMEINTSSGSTDFKMDGDTAPAIEYAQEGEKRTIAIRNIKNLSCELNQETLDRIATPRGAGIAMCVGASVGLIGWFLISTARALSVPRIKKNDPVIPPITFREDSGQSEGSTSEENENYSG